MDCTGISGFASGDGENFVLALTDAGAIHRHEPGILVAGDHGRRHEKGRRQPAPIAGGKPVGNYRQDGVSGTGVRGCPRALQTTNGEHGCCM